MQDMQAYLEKLSTDAVDCALISRRATDPRKKVLFDLCVPKTSSGLIK